MVAPLTVKYDAEGDIPYLDKPPPYAGQESEELDYGIIAPRLNPSPAKWRTSKSSSSRRL